MSADASGVLLVFSNLPDEAAARKLARHLVEAKLAACVNVLSPCVSTYRWRGAVEEASEVPVISRPRWRLILRWKPRSAKVIPMNSRRSSRSHWRKVFRRTSTG